MRLRGTVQKRPAQRISLSDKPRRKFRAVSFVAAVMAAVLTASAGIGAYAADAETVPPIKYTVIEAESEDAAEGTIEQAPDPDAIKGARIPEEKEPSKETEKTADENASGDSQGGEEAAAQEASAEGASAEEAPAEEASAEEASTEEVPAEEAATEQTQETQGKDKKLIIWVPKTDYYEAFESLKFITKSGDEEGTKNKTTAYFVTLAEGQPVNTNEGEYCKFSFKLSSDDAIKLEAFGISSNEEAGNDETPLNVERGEIVEAAGEEKKGFPWLIVIAAAGVSVIALIAVAIVLSRKGKKPKKEEYSALKEAISCERPSELRVYELKANGAPAIFSFEMTDRGARHLTELESNASGSRMSFLKKTKLANTAVKAAGKELHLIDTGKKPEEVLCVLNEAHSVVELEAGEGTTLRLIWIPGTRTDG